MKELQVFENELFELIVKAENGENLFDAESVAKSLGIVQTKSEKEFVRWERVNLYLNFDSPQVGKGDFISESMVYKLAFKASNDIAEKFQDWLAVEVLPSLRKQLTLPTDPMEILKLTFEAQENTDKEVKEVKERVANLESNQKIGADDYGYINRRVSQRVTEVAKCFGEISQEQRKLLYKDIGGGIKTITGVPTRSQLRERHFDDVLEFIQDWEPSTATKTLVRQVGNQLKEGA